MPELQNVQHLLEEAKRAAEAGDLASADALLRDAARIQEAELGRLHPELANTVNNLAIVAEMSGRFQDAEAYYRRAVAITSAALPPDDPIVASSRKNLDDFCRERGVPFAAAPAEAAIERAGHPTDEVADDPAITQTNTPADMKLIDAGAIAERSSPASDHLSGADSADATDRLPAPVTPPRRSIATVAIVLVAVVVAVLLVMRPWSARESPPHQTVEPAPRTVEPPPAPPTAAAPVPTEQQEPSPVASPSDTPHGAASPATAGRAPGGMTLATSQLCRTFSVGHNWQCDPAGESVGAGALVLYTRVRSPRDAIVIHQWYRGDTLRKSARLPILANTTDGYRTYSRQTVSAGEDWRVEVRNPAGDLLYEQRVSVR